MVCVATQTVLASSLAPCELRTCQIHSPETRGNKRPYVEKEFYPPRHWSVCDTECRRRGLDVWCETASVSLKHQGGQP